MTEMATSAARGTLRIGGTAVEPADAQVVAPPGSPLALRDVLISSPGSEDSGLDLGGPGVVRYDGDEGSDSWSTSSAESSAAPSSGGYGPPAPVDGCEMTVGGITLTDSTANIGIFKNYVIITDEVPAFPGMESVSISLKEAQAGRAVSGTAAASAPGNGKEDDAKPSKAYWIFKKSLRWPWAFVPSAAVSAVILVVIYLTLTHPPTQAEENEATDPIILPNGVEYASRRVWKAMPPKRVMPALALPIETVIVHHTATSACFMTSSCIERVAAMQRSQMDGEGRNWADIGYNFLVGGDGVVYEGRGWQYVGGHFENEIWSRPTLGIAAIGNFVETQPAENQLQELRKFMAWAVTEGRIASDYKLYGVCQLIATKSPGLQLMARLRTWPHWDSFVKQPNVSCTE
ncbi:Peptidoglycan-recognition protein LF [Frankliniella fusca]|uniref:Peptidoglycan-recognition protein LF n=1 Tax=Frankliniella fusca TaxID=407009 RepID=A0AAE1H1K5_9NEOP|nr:Peptidoglycan-recognition protein LF [Frankliniella fusca]